MTALIRVTDDTTVAELGEALASLCAAREVANPVRHEVLTERIESLLEERFTRSQVRA